MSLHPLAAQFSTVADVYERGRPEYPPAVVGAIAGELDLSPGARVLDLAAGTGKLTRALLAAGLDVVAVEPQAPMREVLMQSVGGERTLEGLAEAIPLGDSTVEAVTVADAFHWFDRELALAEIRRVLAPGGGLAVISTGPDWRGASWAHAVGSLMRDARPEHPHFDGPAWGEVVRAAGGWSAPREIRVTSAQPADAERVLVYLQSLSWVAAIPESERADLLARVSELIGEGETPAEMPTHFQIGLASLL